MSSVGGRGNLPLRHSFLRLVSGTVEIYGVKLAEDSDLFIVKGAEITGSGEMAVLEFALPVRAAHFVDLHEQESAGDLTTIGHSISFVPRRQGVFAIAVRLDRL